MVQHHYSRERSANTKRHDTPPARAKQTATVRPAGDGRHRNNVDHQPRWERNHDDDGSYDDGGGGGDDDDEHHHDDGDHDDHDDDDGRP